MSEQQELELDERGSYERADPRSAWRMWRAAIQLALVDATRLRKGKCCSECWGVTMGPCIGAIRWIFDDDAFIEVCDSVDVDWRQARKLVINTWCEQRYCKLVGARWRPPHRPTGEDE